MDALIDSITELVLQELARAQAPAPIRPDNKRKLLLCPAPGSELSGPVYESLRKLDVSWLVTVWPGFPKEKVDALLQRPWCPAQGDPDSLVRQVQAVVIPSLTLELLPRLAILLGDLPPVQMAIAALVQNVPVLAASEEPDRFRRHAARLPAGLTAVVQQHIRTIEGFGLKILPAQALAEELSQTAQKPPQNRGRDVITQEDLLHAVKAGQKLFEVPAGAIVTPLALETARLQGIEVRYR